MLYEVITIVNLPFVIDSFEKLETFRNTPELFREFSESADAQGIKVSYNFV